MRPFRHKNLRGRFPVRIGPFHKYIRTIPRLLREIAAEKLRKPAAWRFLKRHHAPGEVNRIASANNSNPLIIAINLAAFIDHLNRKRTPARDSFFAKQIRDSAMHNQWMRRSGPDHIARTRPSHSPADLNQPSRIGLPTYQSEAIRIPLDLSPKHSVRQWIAQLVDMIKTGKHWLRMRSRRQHRFQIRQFLATHVQAWRLNLYPIRKRTIRVSIEQPSSFCFANTSPLLKKEFRACRFTLRFDAPNPIGGHRARSRPALAANDYPVNSPQVYRPKVLQERFD